MTTITIQSQSVQNALNELARRTQNLQPAFDSIGEDLKNNVAMCFRDEQSPDGVNWQALHPITIAKRRNRSNKILNDTGRLKGSFAHVATNSYAEVTTDVEYAAIHQFGGQHTFEDGHTARIPPRPFFPAATLPQNWERDILQALEAHLLQ